MDEHSKLTQEETPWVDLDTYLVDEKVVNLIPEAFARKHHLIPLFKIGNILTVAMADPKNILAIDEVALKTGCEVEPVIATESQIERAVDQYYGVSGSIEEIIKEVADKGIEFSGGEEAPVIKLLNLIMLQAVRDRASDIHLEPDEDTVRTRYRIDGILHEVTSLPKSLQQALISRIKVMGGLDIAETRTPQDGRAHIKMAGKEIELRISAFPTMYGENLVLRILDQSTPLMGLEDLGFFQEMLRYYESLIRRVYGIILVTGPTGSGKTTTLYASLNAINSPEKNIITIEDPIEYRLNLIRQTQVNPKAGITFAAAIRSILRQDPDIIMVGEVRDFETSETAIRAAITGHLVFSTLHTNDAPGALTRLMDMGVEPFLISGSILGILAQRLVRTICPYCKESYVPDEREIETLSIANTKETVLYRGKGCKMCRQTGYRGRTAVFELLVINEPIRELIMERAPSRVIRKTASETQGMKTLREDGLEKVLKGITTLGEIIRQTFEQDLKE